jgi:hypothetical protein
MNISLDIKKVGVNSYDLTCFPAHRDFHLNRVKKKNEPPIWMVHEFDTKVNDNDKALVGDTMEFDDMNEAMKEMFNICIDAMSFKK